ncbi:pyridoxal-phosphate dependent enzyme [uncultured Pseudoteredinibacter sp.]|uniref:1-aminocyclopropane-1-carboxylate deaminase/D-cysteine desulfhydrase n=1 Tax=uncultured Pseudoteredinibacter sp. TaxID=1641701 RepID=UPI0026212163|nr:pyridoxal-phosphate dependent enzyme [uncultured Pseudoteredinibacter sp.]
MKRPLFEAFPGLGEHIPSLALAKLPTPIEPLPELAPNLWIKRDDKTNTLYGGNKVRKLEFILADVIKSKKKKLVSFGAIGTNHGVATAIYALQMGITLKLLLFKQPVTNHVQQNIKLMHRFNAKLHYQGSLFRTALNFYIGKLFKSQSNYYLFAGGSNILGCIAFVNAAFELKQQIDDGTLPEPDYIYCPVGSSSTLAGLSLGCALAGLKSQLVGIRVAPSHIGPIPACTRGTVHKLRQNCFKYLCQMEASFKDIELPEIQLQDDYFGRGYGHATNEGRWAEQMFEQTQIQLEPTYTAKTAAAALNCCANQSDKKVLYWHTFNSADVKELAAKADMASIPKELRRFLQTQPL